MATYLNPQTRPYEKKSLDTFWYWKLTFYSSHISKILLFLFLNNYLLAYALYTWFIFLHWLPIISAFVLLHSSFILFLSLFPDSRDGISWNGTNNWAPVVALPFESVADNWALYNFCPFHLIFLSRRLIGDVLWLLDYIIFMFQVNNQVNDFIPQFRSYLRLVQEGHIFLFDGQRTGKNQYTSLDVFQEYSVKIYIHHELYNDV